MPGSSADAFRVRAITPADKTALDRFRCAELGRPWTEPLEDLVRHQLTQELTSTSVNRALGLFDGSELAAVVAWRMEVALPTVARVLALATDLRFRRRGYARRLKLEVLTSARADGRQIVASQVHRDNTPMLHLNESLGARIHLDTIDEDGYVLCTIPLDRSQNPGPTTDPPPTPAEDR